MSPDQLARHHRAGCLVSQILHRALTEATAAHAPDHLTERIRSAMTATDEYRTAVERLDYEARVGRTSMRQLVDSIFGGLLR